MTRLNYRIDCRGPTWIVSCECVPIDSFESEKAAIEAGKFILAAAKERGDQACLVIAGTAQSGHGAVIRP